jgi:hypothetical protein
MRSWVYDFVFNMGCGHKWEVKKVSKRTAEVWRQRMYEKNCDMCPKCWAKYADEHGKERWE